MTIVFDFVYEIYDNDNGSVILHYLKKNLSFNFWNIFKSNLKSCFGTLSKQVTLPQKWWEIQLQGAKHYHFV